VSLALVTCETREQLTADRTRYPRCGALLVRRVHRPGRPGRWPVRRL